MECSQRAGTVPYGIPQNSSIEEVNKEILPFTTCSLLGDIRLGSLTIGGAGLIQSVEGFAVHSKPWLAGGRTSAKEPIVVLNEGRVIVAGSVAISQLGKKYLTRPCPVL